LVHQDQRRRLTVDLDSTILRGPCLADLNGDGVVDAADLAILLGSWDPVPDRRGWDSPGWDSLR
jgi:hypothetical protein